MSPSRLCLLIALTLGPGTAPCTAAGPAWRLPLTPAFRFDRVEEGRLALRGRHTGPGGVQLRAEAGFSTGLERWGLQGMGRWGRGWRGGYSFLEADLHRGAGSHYGSAVWPTVVNTVQALLAEDDYFDYYWNAGYALTAGHDLPWGHGRVRLDWRDEDHSALAKTTDRDLFGRDEILRANPAVDEGQMRRLCLTLGVGGDAPALGAGHSRRAQVEVEHSADWMGGDFDFTRVHAELDWHQPTLPLAGAGLDVRVTAGTHRGRLPVQRFGALDVAVGPVTPYGTLRAAKGHPFLGERYLGLFWQHDFGALPGLQPQGIGLAAHGAYGRTWIDAQRRAALPLVPRWTKTPHREVGGSLLLFDRVRLAATRRLDPGHWAWGVALERLDAQAWPVMTWLRTAFHRI